MIDVSQIREMVTAKLEGTPLFVLEVAVRKGNKIQVTIDGDEGVSIDDCVSLSRFIEGSLDREKEDFDLQVSSGGADRPLVLRRQYPRHLGRTLEVQLLDGSIERGKLMQATSEYIELKLAGAGKKKPAIDTETNLKIAYTEIKQSIIILSFSN